MQPDADSVVVGRVVGARGLRGELRVEVLSDSPTRFTPGRRLYLDGVPVRIEKAQPSRAGVLLKLTSIDDRASAQRARGGLLTVPSLDVDPLPEGSYYHFQIIDSEVWAEDGERLGRVKEILTAPGNDVYVVRRAGRRDLLLPVLSDVVLDVDVDERRIRVRVPEGLE